MILKALVDYYDRLPESERSPYGFATKEVGFCLVLNDDGTLAEVQPLSAADKRGRLVRRSIELPDHGQKRTAQDRPFFLWDKTDYLFGAGKEAEDDERNGRRFELFRDFHLRYEQEVDAVIYRVFCSFLRSWMPKRAIEISNWPEVAGENCVVSFRGQQGFLHEVPAARQVWFQILSELESDEGFCLITGQHSRIARLHPAVKNVRDPGGQAEKGIVAFNKDKTAFDSYGKEQAYNAPTSIEAAFKYASALNALLNDGRRTVSIGQITITCWTQQPEPFVDEFANVVVEPPPDDPAAAERVRNFFHRLRQGADASDLGNPSTPFYVLGLSPNAARISVRFFLAGTVGEFAERLRDHLESLEIVGARPERPLTVRRIINTTLRYDDDGRPDYDSLNERLTGDLVRAILGGTAYPQQVLARVARGVAADGAVTAERAAILKACLVRNYEKEISVALDTQRADTPYRLGRLFAAFEKTQEDAYEGKLNRTIKDGYFSSASASPAAVFPRLCRLNHHHIEKLEGGRKVNREKLIREIVAPLGQFPRSLPLEDQGAFFIGYYHQRQDFFTAKDQQEDGQ